MNFAVRKTVTNELFAQLEQLFESDAVPGEFTLAKLERDADALQRADAADAFMVKAGIAALRWSDTDTQYWATNSLRLDGGIENLLNAAFTYRQLNRLDLVTELMLQCYAKFPRDASVVDTTLESLGMSGRFARASIIHRQALADDVILAPGALLPDQYVNFMAELHIDSDRVAFEVNAAHQILTKNCKRVRAFKIEQYHDHDDSASLVIQVGFFGGIGDELRLESELAQVLGDAPGWNPCLLTTEFYYLEPHAHEYA